MAKKKKRFGHSKNQLRSIVKKIGSLGASGVAVAPALIPIAAAASSLSGGAKLTDAFDAGLNKVGIDTDGTLDVGKMVKYGMLTAGCIGMAMLIRQGLKRA